MDVFSRRFGFDEPANFEGSWHCHVFVSWSRSPRISSWSPATVERELDAARATLLAIRGKRVWPGLDDKILTSWNALAIRGLAIAARNLAEPKFAAAAERALEFIRANAVARRRRWRGPTAGYGARTAISHLNAYLDDYAYLANALLEMLQLRWRNEDADLAARRFST